MKVSQNDLDLIIQIRDRLLKELPQASEYMRSYAAYYLLLWHEWVEPINLELLLAARLSDLAHDVGGIIRYYEEPNHGFFNPRCSSGANPRIPHESSPEEQDADAHVAEWVGQHYQINFNTCSRSAKAMWRERYEESLQ